MESNLPPGGKTFVAQNIQDSSGEVTGMQCKVECHTIGFYKVKNSEACGACHWTCGKCSGSSKSDCFDDGCLEMVTVGGGNKKSYIWNNDYGFCVEKCIKGKYYDEFNDKCIPCPGNDLGSCWPCGTTSDDCYDAASCMEGYIWDEDPANPNTCKEDLESEKMKKKYGLSETLTYIPINLEDKDDADPGGSFANAVDVETVSHAAGSEVTMGDKPVTFQDPVPVKFTNPTTFTLESPGTGEKVTITSPAGEEVILPANTTIGFSPGAKVRPQVTVKISTILAKPPMPVIITPNTPTPYQKLDIIEFGDPINKIKFSYPVKIGVRCPKGLKNPKILEITQSDIGKVRTFEKGCSVQFLDDKPSADVKTNTIEFLTPLTKVQMVSGTTEKDITEVANVKFVKDIAKIYKTLQNIEVEFESTAIIRAVSNIEIPVGRLMVKPAGPKVIFKSDSTTREEQWLRYTGGSSRTLRVQPGDRLTLNMETELTFSTTIKFTLDTAVEVSAKVDQVEVYPLGRILTFTKGGVFKYKYLGSSDKTVNVTSEPPSGIDRQGGTCKCPDGEINHAGVKTGSSPPELACSYGLPSKIDLSEGPWSYKKVECYVGIILAREKTFTAGQNMMLTAFTALHNTGPTPIHLQIEEKICVQPNKRILFVKDTIYYIPKSTPMTFASEPTTTVIKEQEKSTSDPLADPSQTLVKSSNPDPGSRDLIKKQLVYGGDRKTYVKNSSITFTGDTTITFQNDVAIMDTRKIMTMLKKKHSITYPADTTVIFTEKAELAYSNNAVVWVQANCRSTVLEDLNSMNDSTVTVKQGTSYKMGAEIIVQFGPACTYLKNGSTATTQDKLYKFQTDDTVVYQMDCKIEYKSSGRMVQENTTLSMLQVQNNCPATIKTYQENTAIEFMDTETICTVGSTTQI
jgi:hypothetical protein